MSTDSQPGSRFPWLGERRRDSEQEHQAKRHGHAGRGPDVSARLASASAAIAAKGATVTSRPGPRNG